MCTSLATAINPAGAALSKLPVPGFISDPAQAAIQGVVGKNVVTDPNYDKKNTPGPPLPGAPMKVPATALAATPATDAATTARRTALSDDDGTDLAAADTTKKTALGS